ncbi:MULTISPECIES: hypothetical protein [Pseudomonas]|jgi:filamentous hemagglutinin|uniref:hypothetical protein n=1 Tax=Pseudomonas TaxID=286 RepID=UPI00256EE082|nr:hypothetical protein [Pseudomonas sp. 29]
MRPLLTDNWVRPGLECPLKTWSVPVLSLSGKKNFTSSMTLTADEALLAGQKYLGGQYTEIGKPGSGVFHSAEGVREFRIDPGSLSGSHAPGVPHVHFGVKDPLTGKYIANNHVPCVE